MSNKKKLKRDDRAARAQALIEERNKAERRRKMLVVAGSLVAVVALLGLVFVIQSRLDSTGDAPQVEPTAAEVEDYGIVLGEDDAAHTVTIYEDLQCPVCAQLDQAVGAQIDEGLEAGTIQLEYRMVSFLDRASTNEYSSRAMNASMVVLEEAGAETFKKFHDGLLDEQPAEGGAGYTDEELIERAVQAGADEAAVTPGIEGKVFEQWIENATDQSSKDGVTGTPTVEIDGERVEDDPVQAINDLVGQ